MKKYLSLLLSLCLLAMVLIVPCSAGAASKKYIEVTKDNAVIRTGAGEKYDIKLRASKGTVIEVLDTAINWHLNKWYKIKTSSGSLYIYSGNVKKVTPKNYTTDIKLDKSAVDLNLAKKESTTLKAICSYKNRSEKNVKWTSSDPKVASVDSNGKVASVGLGTCTITATHNIFGTKATCNITVTEQVTLNCKPTEQSNSSCCSGASARTVLQCVKGSSPSDLQLYKEMGSSGTVGKIVDRLNHYLGSKKYTYTTKSSQSAYTDTVIKSVKAGYPVIALIKITSKNYFKYTSNGHFTTISGYRRKINGDVEFRITDSYKTNSNGGNFWIPAKDLFGYSKAHNNRYYLIVKK